MLAATKKFQVFISSTYVDLKLERQAAVEAVLKAGHIPAGMELFSAGNESQLDTIRRWIDQSDIYMLILGGRYGSVDPSSGQSYTELEYDYALSKDKPIFAVVISEKAIDTKVTAEGKSSIETDHPKELKLFRKKVLDRISSFFDEPKDIKLAVHETIGDFKNRYEFTGWISGSEVPDSAGIMEEMVHLRNRNVELEKEVVALKIKTANAKKAPSNGIDEEEYLKLFQVFTTQKITTAAFKEDKQLVTYPLVKILEACINKLILGVEARPSSTEVDSLLYYKICPKLEIYGLATKEPVDGFKWLRYKLTQKGLDFARFLDERQPQKPPKKQSVEANVGT